MSDLLSPILVVMENEVDAFWCFAGLMERVVSKFKCYTTSEVYLEWVYEYLYSKFSICQSS